MEFNWTTFALEILNFLVLLWILKRFLYQPVRNVVAQRKAAIDASVGQAESLRAAADDLKRQYERRMADWEAERSEARTQLAEEIAAERAHLMDDVRRAIESERDKARALEQRQAIELRQKITRDAVGSAAAFATRLLQRLAGPALEKRIGEIAIEDMPTLQEEQIRDLRQACLTHKVRITSAYELPAGLRADLAAALSTLAGGAVDCEYACDPALIAGVRIAAGAWLLRCSLTDELAFFTDTGVARAA